MKVQIDTIMFLKKHYETSKTGYMYEAELNNFCNSKHIFRNEHPNLLM